MKAYLDKYTKKRPTNSGGDYVQSKRKKKRKKKRAAVAGLRIIDEDYDWRKDRDKTNLARLNEIKQSGATIVTMEEAISKQKEDEEDEIFKQARARMLRRNDGSGWQVEGEDGDAKEDPVPLRHDSDDDGEGSPPPRRRHDSDAEDDDNSPAPRRRHDSDAEDGGGDDDVVHRRGGKADKGAGGGGDDDDDESPVRRRGRHDSDDDNDMSPVRSRARHDPDDEGGGDLEPRRANKDSGGGGDDDDDIDVRRRGRKAGGDSDEDLTVRRRAKPTAEDEDDLEPACRRWTERNDDSVDMEPVRRRAKNKEAEEKGGEDTEEPVKMGLLTSKEFTTQNLKKEKVKMDELKGMDPTLSGANAKTVFRDKRGRKLESFAKFQAQQAGIFVDNEEAGMVWGKGLAQEEELEKEKEELSRLSEAPFARSRDDERMNAELRQRERWGDPFLKMMRKKKKKKKKKKTEEEPETVIISSRPYYQGQGWSNRYGIRPGYRWDGVDRSNKWEAKRMLHINNMEVRKSQGYRWGASAM